jgi:hypothetical protein
MHVLRGSGGRRPIRGGTPVPVFVPVFAFPPFPSIEDDRWDDRPNITARWFRISSIAFPSSRATLLYCPT